MKPNDNKNLELYMERALPKGMDNTVRQTIVNFLHPTNYHGIIESEDDLGNAVWIAGLSITKFDIEKHLPIDFEYFEKEERDEYFEKEGTPDYIARFIIMSSDTAGDHNPTIMGFEVYFKQNFGYNEVSETWGSYNSIWENLWIESQPALMDSGFMEGISWINELSPFNYICIDNPFEVEKPRVYFSPTNEKDEEIIATFKKKYSKAKTYTTLENN